MTESDFIYQSQIEAECACLDWQCVLRLQDWDFDVFICRMEKMDLEDSCGTVNMTLSKRHAIIKLLDPVDYSPEFTVPQDHEVTLVHEMIHCKLDKVCNTGENQIANDLMEQAIHDLSRALVTLKRRADAAGATDGEN